MFRVSERFACKAVGQHRSTQRHAIKFVDIEEAMLRRRLSEITAEHFLWGRRMAYRVLRQEGWTVKHTGAPALAGGGTPEAYASQGEASQPRRWLHQALQSRASASGLGYGLPVRRHR